MTTKHTPGPWAAEPQLTPDGRMGAAWNIVADDWPAVAVAEVRREADALLISAAPKMLDLARHVVAMADDAYLIGHPEWGAIVAEARAAIAAAGVDP
jgi:hypothetical protein